MKVLPVIDTRRVGGPGKGLISLIRASRGSIEHPGVVTYRRRGDRPSDFSRALVEAGIREFVIEESGPISFGSASALRKLIAEVKPDIVQTHGYKANFFLALETAWDRGERDWRWVSWIHGYTAENLKIRLYNRIERWAAPRADHMVLVSCSLRDLLVSSRTGSTVVPNGIDAEYEHVDPAEVRRVSQELRPDGKQIVLVVGRFSHEKGQDRIPGIAAELAARRDDFRFVLVGEGPEEERIRSLIVQHGVERHVELRPFVSDVRAYFSASAVCALPSRREGMPNVVLESLLLGCPLASMDVGGVTEIVSPGREALVVEQGDSTALAEAIDSLLSSEQLRARLTEAGRTRVRTAFLSSTRAARVWELYADLLAESALGSPAVSHGASAP